MHSLLKTSADKPTVPESYNIEGALLSRIWYKKEK